MSKNLTRKGLAFGALIALGTSVIAGAPALAAGIDNGNVSLAPKAGTEYNTLASASFELKANFSNAAKTTGAYLKFKVEDAAVKSTVGYAGSSQYAITGSGYAVSNGDGSNGAPTGTKNLVTVTSNGHLLKVGDKVQVSGAAAADGGIDGYVSVTATGTNTFSYVRLADSDAITSEAVDVVLVASYQTAASTTAARGTGTTYIFDTKSDSNLADKSIRITSTDEDTTQSVIVTAWIDQNDNGLIDTTEYQSPARTVTFYKNSDVTATTVIRPSTVGNSTVVADVKFSPVLNGNQLSDSNLFASGAAAVVNAKFGRVNDSATPTSATTTYDDDTKKWTVTSINFNASGWTDTHNSKPAQMITAATGANDIASYSVIKNVATINTVAAHGLRVGDKVTVAASVTRIDTTTGGGLKVTSVPSTTSFTYAVETAQESANDTALTTPSSAISDAVTAGTLLRDSVEAGDVSAQAYLYNLSGSTAAFEKSGAKATYTVGSKVVGATGLSIVGVASATVSADGTNVYKGTTTGALTVKVKNADGDYVGEGVDVVLTVSSLSVGAGTLTINGEKASTGSVHYAKTNASGKVVVNFVNTSAAAGENFALAADSQGASQATKTVTWADKVYSIVDLNDSSAVASAARNRAVASGASYTFDFLVQDQFKAVAGDDIRLKVASATRTVFTNTFALTAGKATVVVADGGLTTGTADVTVTLEKKATDGTWSALADASGNTWDGAGAGDLAIVNINYYSQTDAITLNADAANYPSSTTADYSAAVSTVALTAADTRITNTSAPAVLAAAKAVVAGKVAHATTSVGKAGVLVTLTGAGLLFKSGDVWTIGSATVLSNDGTFAVEVYSSASGDKKVTVAVGSVSTTATVTFTGASTTAKKLTITPSSTTYVAGQTVVYTILLTDTNGNPINTVAPAATPASEYITVSYEGPGIISGSLPLETDADGKATVRIVTGTSDVQNAVLTVKYDQNYDGDYVDTYDLTVVSTVPVLVVEPSAVVNVVGHRVYVKFNDAKGEEVSAVIGGVRITKTATYSGYVISKLVKKVGKVAVKAYVAGDLVKASTVTVK